VYNNPMGDSELSSSCPNTGVLQSCGAGSACGGFASINDCLTSGNAQSNFTDSQAYCNKLCPGSYSSFVSCISTSKAGQSGKPQYCVPTDSFSGNGICTSQLGLISNVTTDKNGYFNESNVTACGSGQVLIKADFYGYPAPEPIEVLQVPLQFTANEVNGNCAETTTAVGAGGTGGVGGAVGGLVGISTGCLADAIALGPQAELNYSYGPTEASQVLQIGLVELKFGGLGALEIVAGAGMALLLIFRHGLGRKEAPKGRKGNALIGKESKHD
jgi:hypothetical protein